MHRLLILATLLATPLFCHAQLTVEELIERTGVRAGGEPLREHRNWRADGKIVLGDYGFSETQIDSLGKNVVLVADMAEALKHAASAVAIIGWCDDGQMDAASGLAWVQIGAAGAERCVGKAKIASGDVILTNGQKMASPMIGEHAIGMAMALSRNLPLFARAMPSGEWARTQEATAGMQSLAGKRLLVVGLGGIGTQAARVGAGLGMRVTGTRNSSREGPEFVEYVGLADEVLELAAQADVVVNALPLTDSTRGLMDAEFFDALKPGALFVNVGRGGTVVTDDLLAALQDGRIAGAGLDVTDPEPLPADHPLWQLENVIITPHVSGRGSEREPLRVLIIENIRRFRAGEQLLNVVDPERGY